MGPVLGVFCRNCGRTGGSSVCAAVCIVREKRDEKTTSVCERLTKAIYTQKNKRKELKAEREKMMHYMTKQREAKIVVREMVYPGTYVYMNSDIMKITECYRNVTFVKKDNTIEHVSR